MKYYYVLYYRGLGDISGFTTISMNRPLITSKNIEELNNFCKKSAGTSDVVLSGFDYLGEMTEKEFLEN